MSTVFLFLVALAKTMTEGRRAVEPSCDRYLGTHPTPQEHAGVWGRHALSVKSGLTITKYENEAALTVREERVDNHHV